MLSWKKSIQSKKMNKPTLPIFPDNFDQIVQSDEFRQWLDERVTHPYGSRYSLRANNIAFVYADAISLEIYHGLAKLFEAVDEKDKIETIRPLWRPVVDPGDNNSIIIQFRVKIKQEGKQAQEYGYDDEEVIFPDSPEKQEAYRRVIEVGEYVNLDTWDWFCQSSLNANPDRGEPDEAREFNSRDQVIEQMKKNIDGEFLSAFQDFCIQQGVQRVPEERTAKPRRSL